MPRSVYAAGETTLLTLLTAQRSLYSARDSLAQSTVEVGLQYIALSLALGRRLGPVVALIGSQS